MAWLDRIVIGIAVYVAFSGAVEQGLLTMFGAAEWAFLLVLIVIWLFGIVNKRLNAHLDVRTDVEKGRLPLGFR